ncbi:heme biosynthesis protein HemY [Rhodobacteraceae bacterium HSP-20]|uniref:Heme biosynthesis protein HemY n=1 Tax=Paragemmobacter amnigenus TaxID=2852097 RepID=A0ABS6J2C4_9RHOB|nr:heme biosynthesis HemY N-terminal domain-containing protein [Rhodobacter amnigenus]MBU9697903.1 heme biosynthesis protein HemY [Rhodobacter amnigenus]MBV4389130.1 heme biosynthesis protein HemY [Rhodobacter amnigenus]
MIWSLAKVLLFILIVATLTLGAGILLDTGGGIRIAAAGYEFTLGPLQALIVFLAMVVLVWLLLKLAGLVVAVFRFLNGDETAISRYFDRNRERKGFQALSEGLLALAAGEGRLALNRAIKAEKYLAEPHLTTLLVAQAAEAAGDTRRATEAYKELLSSDTTRFVAIRGLLRQKLAEGDSETAQKLAVKALELKPRHEETQDILLKLQAESRDWKGARATLGAKLKAGALPRDVYRRRDAVLALQQAQGVLDEGATVEAREAAIEANRQSPDLIPAAAMAARAMAEKGDRKGAMRVLKKAWDAKPHPDLAAAFADIEPAESPTQRLKRFQTLTANHPAHEETRLLMAELNIAAEDFPAARRALADIVEKHPTQRALAIMAAIERGEGADEAVVRGWLAKALTAPRGPQWCCDKCQAVHAKWDPICDNCGGFDTLSWREPPERTGPSATGAEVLPLIVSPPKSADQTPAPQSGASPEPEVIDLEAIVRRGG